LEYAARSVAPAARGTVGAGQPYSGSVEANYAMQYVRVADVTESSALTVQATSTGTARTSVACTLGGRLVLAGTADATAGRPAQIALPLGACDPGTAVAVLTSASRTGDHPSTDTDIAYDLAVTPASAR
jgi:hypothetical protein